MKSLLRLIGAGVLLVSGNAWASSIPIIGPNGGFLDIGNFEGTLVGVTPSCINWAATTAVPNPPCQITTGNPDAVSSADSADFTSPSTGTIKDIPTVYTSPLVDFQTVNSPLAGGVVNFDLVGLVVPGQFGNCSSAAVNNSCNPGGGSPFTLLQQTSNSVIISFAANEYAYTGLSSTGTTPYVATFSTTLTGNLPDSTAMNPDPDTIPDILNYFQANGEITSTWSATESAAPTPEPFSFVLLGIGLTGIGLIRHRRINSPRA